MRLSVNIWPKVNNVILPSMFSPILIEKNLREMTSNYRSIVNMGRLDTNTGVALRKAKILSA